MLFGLKLKNEEYQPWESNYINYDKLKLLLKENIKEWTDDDEFDFVTELNLNLNKVYSFQRKTYAEVNESINNLEKLSEFESLSKFNITDFQNKLEHLLTISKNLDQFARLNYTGFIKIVKKHDRFRSNYSVRPLLMVQLENLPFHSEDYSPLLYKLSSLYSFLRENFKVSESLSKLSSVNNEESLNYKNFKFWIHPENLTAVQYEITGNYLPTIVYGNHVNDDQKDPITTCLYFDNKNFDLYNAKLEKITNSKSLRIKWSGKLYEKPNIVIEEKFVDDLEQLNEIKVPVKEKWLNSIIKGDLKSNKSKSQITAENNNEQLQMLQREIINNNLQPTLRTTYKRQAYQFPGDDKIRINIDSDILFIREDSFDEERPIRDPNSWHRVDIDSKIDNPLSLLRKGEFSKFPYAVMDIRVKNSVWNSKREEYEWIHELCNSHLVKSIPNFSKFIQGVSSLFIEDDKLDNIPFWFHDLDSDIRKDPKQAYEDEILKQNIQKDEESKLNKFKSLLSPAIAPTADNLPVQNISEEELPHHKKRMSISHHVPQQGYNSKLDVDSEDEEIVLPPGVKEPTTFLKNQGSLKIEPKVWLANERTFNKWLHVTTLLSSLTFIMNSTVKKAHYEDLAISLSYIYFFITLFCGGWGYYIFIKRSKLIEERSGKHLDGIFGPVVVAGSLMIALIINFVVSFKNAKDDQRVIELLENAHPVHQYIHEFMVSLLGV